MWEVEENGDAWRFLFSLNDHWRKYFPSEVMEHAIFVSEELLNFQRVVLDDPVRFWHTNNIHRKHFYKKKKLKCKSSNQLHFPLFPVIKSSTSFFFFFQKLSVFWTFVSNLFNAIVTCQSISDSFAFRLTDVFLVNTTVSNSAAWKAPIPLGSACHWVSCFCYEQCRSAAEAVFDRLEKQALSPMIILFFFFFPLLRESISYTFPKWTAQKHCGTGL